MARRRWWTVLGVLLLSNLAAARPGAVAGGEDGESHLTILQPPQTRPCVARGTVCFFAAEGTTLAADSGSFTTVSKRHSPATVRPSFSRTSTTTDEKGKQLLRDQPWQLLLTAMLRRPAWAGNAVVVVYDLDNPTALATRTIMGLYQALIPAGRSFGAQLSLSPGDGYQEGRTYRVQVLQLIQGKEILLAESDITLM
jgi:hypothetical protein